jgi:hypothetical protein
VLQDGEVRAVGGLASRRVDVRVIAATNRSLAAMRDDRMRPDLFYRLSVLVIEVPPLRDRRDLPAGDTSKIMPYNRGARRPPAVRSVTAGAGGAGGRTHGRATCELVNVMGARSRRRRRHPGCGGLAGDDPGGAQDAPVRALTNEARARRHHRRRVPDELMAGTTFRTPRRSGVVVQRDYIVLLLKRHGGNISHAAREADIDRKYFRKLMKSTRSGTGRGRRRRRRDRVVASTRQFSGMRKGVRNR